VNFEEFVSLARSTRSTNLSGGFKLHEELKLSELRKLLRLANFLDFISIAFFVRFTIFRGSCELLRLTSFTSYAKKLCRFDMNFTRSTTVAHTGRFQSSLENAST